MENTKLLTSAEEIRGAIRATLASGEFAVAVPYWGGKAFNDIGLGGDLTNRGRILCNLPSGACDPNVIRDLMSRGANIRSLSMLHAKTYIGQQRAVIGSANVSNQGLGIGETPCWSEACISIGTPVALHKLYAWFDDLWKAAADLSDPQIARLLLESADRNYNQNSNGESLDLLKALEKSADQFTDSPLYIALDWEPYGEEVEKGVNTLREATGEDIDAWEDWPDMPKNAQILSFYYNQRARKRYSYEGAWQSPVDPKSAMDPGNKAIYVHAVPRILGRFQLGDVSTWLKAIARLRNRVFEGSKPDVKAATVHVLDFAKQYLALK